jgi:hypothetical protein
MDKRMPETCWAVFKPRAINLRDWCVWLVDLFECMMMHGLTNPKFRFDVVLSIPFAPAYHSHQHTNRTSTQIAPAYQSHLQHCFLLYTHNSFSKYVLNFLFNYSSKYSSHYIYCMCDKARLECSLPFVIIVTCNFQSLIYCHILLTLRQQELITLGETHSLSVFENLVLRKLLEHTMEELIKGIRKLRNEERHDMQPSSNIIRLISWKRIKRLGYVNLMEKYEDKRPPGRPKSREKNNSEIVTCWITVTYITKLFWRNVLK